METTALAMLALAMLSGGISWILSDSDDSGVLFVAGITETIQYVALIYMAKAIGL